MNNRNWQDKGLYGKIHGIKSTDKQKDMMRRDDSKKRLDEDEAYIRGAVVRSSDGFALSTHLTRNFNKIIEQNKGIMDPDHRVRMMWGQQELVGDIDVQTRHGLLRNCTIEKYTFNRRPCWNLENFERMNFLSPKAKIFLDVIKHLNPMTDINIRYGTSPVMIEQGLDLRILFNDDTDFHVEASGGVAFPDDRSRALVFLYAYLMVWDDANRLISDLSLDLDASEPRLSSSMDIDKFHMLVGVVRECLEIRRLQREGKDPKDLISRFPLYPISQENWNYIHSNEGTDNE